VNPTVERAPAQRGDAGLASSVEEPKVAWRRVGLCLRSTAPRSLVR
jgi:hypothetical protein